VQASNGKTVLDKSPGLVFLGHSRNKLFIRRLRRQRQIMVKTRAGRKKNSPSKLWRRGGKKKKRGGVKQSAIPGEKSLVVITGYGGKKRQKNSPASLVGSFGTQAIKFYCGLNFLQTGEYSSHRSETRMIIYAGVYFGKRFGICRVP